MNEIKFLAILFFLKGAEMFYTKFDLECLVAVNRIRMIHGMHPVHLDKRLTRAARTYMVTPHGSSGHFAPGRQIVYWNAFGTNELDNLWSVYPSSNFSYHHCLSALSAWYGEIECFNFERGASTAKCTAGHYIAFMSNVTQSIGCGRRGDRRYYEIQCAFSDRTGSSVHKYHRRIFEPYEIPSIFRHCLGRYDYNSTHYRQGCEKEFRKLKKLNETAPIPPPTRGEVFGYERYDAERAIFFGNQKSSHTKGNGTEPASKPSDTNGKSPGSEGTDSTSKSDAHSKDPDNQDASL